MREPTWTEIDGVPVAWIPTPGPLSAVLNFRVGMAAETAPRRGITHLVEHLALYGMHDRPYALNGVVGLTRTAFYANGHPDEVVEFLQTVCRRLGDLPLDRVETERGILRAESESRRAGYFSDLLYWRYGAQGHGLVGVMEHGLNWLDAASVRWWAEQRFTRQNAVLTLSGEPPPGLRLPLADGPPQPPVRAEPVETVIPGWVSIPANGIALGAVLHRTPAATIATQLAEQELTRVLRFERGLTYSVGADYEPLDADRAHAILAADATEEHRAQLCDAFLEVVEGLAERGPAPAALAKIHDRRSRVAEDDLALGTLDWIGQEFALGRPYESPIAVRARVDATTSDDVAAALREMAGTALYAVPAPVELPAPRYPPVPMWCSDTVTGDVYGGCDGRSSLVVGSEGMMVVFEGNPVTVRWANTAAALWWPNGSRVVIGRDGFRITFVPGDWVNGADAVARVDAAVPRHALVPMQGDGPGLTLPEPAPAPARAGRRLWRTFLTVFGYFMALGLLALAADGPSPATETSPEFTRGDVVVAFGLGVVALAGSVWSTVTLVRGRRRRT